MFALTIQGMINIDIVVFFTIAGDVGEIISEEEVKLNSLNATTTLVPYLSPEIKGDQGHLLEQKVCTIIPSSPGPFPALQCYTL